MLQAETQKLGHQADSLVTNLHLPFRRWQQAMHRLRQMKTLKESASVRANIHSHISLERHLIDFKSYKERRSGWVAKWRILAS